jgi:adenosylcobinamide-GDP ribazoletransferase
MISAFVTALRTLTIIPFPGKDTEDYSKSLLFFPLAGGIIALLLYPFFWLCQQIPENFSGVQGLLFTLFTIIITGGLHIDGIADVADGFLGGKTKEKILIIMKDSRIGTFGAIAIAMDLLFRYVLFGYIISNLTFLPVVCALINSRSAQAIVLSSCKYARGPEGTAAPFSGNRKKLPLMVVSILLINGMLCFLFGIALILPSIFVTIVAVSCIVWYYNRRINGVTGDCIGSINEIAEIIFLLTWCIISNLK